jgi:hypothetical protein
MTKKNSAHQSDDAKLVTGEGHEDIFGKLDAAVLSIGCPSDRIDEVRRLIIQRIQELREDEKAWSVTVMNRTLAARDAASEPDYARQVREGKHKKPSKT